MEVHQAVRQALGPDFVLMSDPVAEYTLEEAIRVGRQLEQLNFYWFEEPFRDFELDKYRKLCAALDIAVAATETTRGGAWALPRQSSSTPQILSERMCLGSRALRVR